ncbi:GNAT family N-acetyltransferase [Streptomyces sp. NPDC057298]|uniref:GNAT family N-acetyltransferase n=1 Tax=Streptomyces sp. NPDC057298 TaxID=3346091 RepID=UPI0036345968
MTAAVEAWSSTPQQRFAHVARFGSPTLCILGCGGKAWVQESGASFSHAAGQLGLHRIFATCDPRNLGSARVLAKLGMAYEGHLRHTAWIRVGWRDFLAFNILEEEWRAGNPQ